MIKTSNHSIELLKKNFFHSPKNINSLIESFCKQNKTTIDKLNKEFYYHNNISLNKYIKLVENTMMEVNEDLSDFITSKLGKTKDQTIAKFSVGGTKQKAIGSLQQRERAEYLFNNWNRMVGKAKLTSDSRNLKLFLRAIYVAPQVINKVIAEYKQYLNPTNQSTPTGLLPSNKIREFFNHVSYLEGRFNLSQLNKQPKT